VITLEEFLAGWNQIEAIPNPLDDDVLAA